MSSAKRTNKRLKRKEMSVSSDEDSAVEEPDDVNENAESLEKSKEALESLSAMSEEEMAEHLQLCMRLSVENKINLKNAFGLHLIEIMQKIVKKNEKADMQQASLSLHASSKIYAGRVEALYQDTCRFHAHLRSIVTGGKKDKKTKDMEDDLDGMDDDTSEKGKKKPQKSKCKSFLKSEESLSIEQDISTSSRGQPHGNFITINSAFSISRLAPKLLSSLQLSNDLCMIRCADSEPCFKPKNPVSSEPYEIPPKFEELLEKIKKIDVSHSQFQALLAASTEASSTLNLSTPKAPHPSSLFNDNDNDADGFAIPSDVSTNGEPRKSEDVETAKENFDVLNITADIFVNEISAAVTNQGFDQTLLPPNSTLKKVLDKSRRSSVKPSVGKSTKKKVHEPFFAGRSAKDVKHLFVKGRSSCLSQKILSEWTNDNTSNIDMGYEFIESMETRRDQDPDYKVTLEEVLHVIKQNDLQFYFRHYFHKQSQIWKFTRPKLSLDASTSGNNFGNQTEKRVGSLGSCAPDNPEALALSFQNLSIHDSLHEEPSNSAGNVSDNEASAVSDTEDRQFLDDLPQSFDTDIEELMVKPPELVRPLSMKFEQRPVNLNTEKIKELFWKIISRRLEVNDSSERNTEQFVLFSEVYEELKNRLEREISEFISMQFAFVILLILTNQKTLLIENVKENSDLSIKQDICESENT